MGELFMFDLGLDIHASFGKHRYGWNWVVSQLAQKYHSPASAIRVLSFVEKDVLFQGPHSDFYPLPSIRKPWVGIFHLPPSVPLHISFTHQLNRFNTEPALKNFLQNCVGFVSLSDHLTSFLQQNILPNRPCLTLLHPTPYTSPEFSLTEFQEFFRNSRRVRIAQLGFWLRKHHVIHRLKSYCPARIDAFHVGINNPHQSRSMLLDLSLNDVAVNPAVFMTSNLSDRHYDRLLSTSVGILPLYDTSANNSLVECIERATPVIASRHPAVIQYLGADYPLYYDDESDLPHLLSDSQFIAKVGHAYEYLRERRALKSLCITTFSDTLNEFIEAL
ncbi:MAG: hypothetical protein ACK55H_03555 [Cyanobacteriota bacterium]